MLPVAIRTNNPGAMWPNPIATQYGATGYENLADGQGNKAAIFPDMVHGAAAQFALWNKKYAGMPLSSAIQKWSGNNSSPEYANFIRNQTGLDLSTPLTPDVLSGPQGVALAKAQSRWEAGRDIGLSDDDWKKAQALAFNGTDPGPISSSQAQTAITKAMAGNSDDNSQLPVGAKPVMFQGGGQPSQGTGLFSMLQGNEVPDTGVGRILGLGNFGSALGAIGRGMVTAANPAAGAALQSANFNQQIAMAPDLKQVGTDMFGHPIMAWVRKMGANGQPSITPATMNGSSSGSTGSTGSTGSNAGGGSMGGMGSNINEDTLRQFQQMQGSPEEKLAALQKMSPAAYSVVQGLRNGSESINLLPRQGEGRAGWIALAQAVDPNFKGESDYAQRVSQAKDETTQGKFGQTLKSADQLMGHLDSLDKAIDNLHNSPIPAWNTLANFFGEQTGNKSTQNALGDFGSFKEAAATELVKMMRANGGAESDVQSWRQKLDEAKSPEQLKAAVHAAIDIMHTTVGSNVDAHNRIFHENKTAEDFLSPKAKAIVQKLGGGSQPKQQTNSQIPDGATATGPNGHQIVMKGGQWLDAQTGQAIN